jgi:hypothetical protein
VKEVGLCDCLSLLLIYTVRGLHLLEE